MVAVDLDPIINGALQYVQDNVPYPIYAFILLLLSHLYAIGRALGTLVLALLAKNPAEWDMQTVLPPFIAILVTYFTLVSIYRTTTFFIRTSFFFIKWGFILAVVAGGLGWVMGQQRGEPATSFPIIEVAMDFINRVPRTVSLSQPRNPTSQQRPRVWESFEQHEAWKQSHEQNDALDAQAVIEGITDWWDKARDVVNEAKVKQDAGKGKASSR
ncbi:hypothetical protein CYLTODRAFT_426176 [Cylindrobasidium torrendii FP15055 ss-10]|uniref:Uncharacterized protein n=1 Tax=Cylindrobasidium torrendii FP15055 ss-10 TaxID=1314674 RepID=A0A0D7B1H1_9AGAR|nr:hypothetical protein CYLTODRAFT_426176 [Cylindrobasidium torrendii FP15055 ss-10]